MILLPVPKAVVGVRFSPPFVCVSVCFFFRTISPNLTQKCSTTSPKTHLGHKVKGQGHESQKHCPRGLLHSRECWLLLVRIISFFTVLYHYMMNRHDRLSHVQTANVQAHV